MSVEVVQQVFQQRHWISLLHLAAQARLRRMSPHRIMRHNLLLFPNRIQTSKLLSAVVAFFNTCETFTNVMQQQQLNAGEIDMGNICFSDE